jgi:hypothetical protein
LGGAFADSYFISGLDKFRRLGIIAVDLNFIPLTSLCGFGSGFKYPYAPQIFIYSLVHENLKSLQE